MAFLKRIDRTMLQLQKLLALAGTVLIVLGVSSGALCRYLLGVSFHGLEELLVIAAFWMYFMGAAYASHTRSHITAEVFSIYCTIPWLKNSVAVLAASITFGLSALYTYWGWQFFAWSLKSGGETTVLQMPLVLGHSAVFLGFAFMSWYFLIELIARLREFRTPAAIPVNA